MSGLLYAWPMTQKQQVQHTRMQKAQRLKREIAWFSRNTDTEGICCYPKDERMDTLIATIIGPKNTPYEGGIFQLEIDVPEKYPFEPPIVLFRTPVYHPNIDDAGRICLDVLNMPPKGRWKPTISVKNILDAILQLLQYPNPSDPLMMDIAEEYNNNKLEFERKARNLTKNNSNKTKVNK